MSKSHQSPQIDICSVVSSLHHGTLNFLTENISSASILGPGLVTGSAMASHPHNLPDQVEIEFEDYRQEEKVVFNTEPMGIHKRGIFFTLKLAAD